MAEWKGKTVTLNRPRAISKGSPGYGKKRKEVFVKGCSSESSRVKRITFGDKQMGMHKDSASRKKSVIALEVAELKATDVMQTTGRAEIGVANGKNRIIFKHTCKKRYALLNVVQVKK